MSLLVNTMYAVCCQAEEKEYIRSSVVKKRYSQSVSSQ
jgi:hypothetical protein